MLEAARPDGRVVVLKSVGPEGGCRGYPDRKWCCSVAKQRSVAEFRRLASQNGLEVIAGGTTIVGLFQYCRVLSRDGCAGLTETRPGHATSAVN